MCLWRSNNISWLLVLCGWVVVCLSVSGFNKVKDWVVKVLTLVHWEIIQLTIMYWYLMLYPPCLDKRWCQVNWLIYEICDWCWRWKKTFQTRSFSWESCWYVMGIMMDGSCTQQFCFCFYIGAILAVDIVEILINRILKL